MEREIQSGDQRKKAIAYFDIELDDAGLEPYAFRAYCRIARRAAGHDSGTCTESVENMAQSCHISRPSMVRALRTLIRRQMIGRVQRRGYTSVYVLLDKEQWLHPDQEENHPVVKEGTTPIEPGKGENHLLVNHRTTPLVKEGTTPPEPGKGENHPLVNHRTTPGKPQNHPLVNHRTTKKIIEVYKEEKKKRRDSGAKAPAHPKSPFHNHPGVTAYRTELGYNQINATQASLIAETIGANTGECPPDWLAFLRELAGVGFKHINNVKVIVLAFGHWKKGVIRAEAVNLAYQELNGNGHRPGGDDRRKVVV